VAPLVIVRLPPLKIKSVPPLALKIPLLVNVAVFVVNVPSCQSMVPLFTQSLLRIRELAPEIVVKPLVVN